MNGDSLLFEPTVTAATWEVECRLGSGLLASNTGYRYLSLYWLVDRLSGYVNIVGSDPGHVNRSTSN